MNMKIDQHKIRVSHASRQVKSGAVNSLSARAISVCDTEIIANQIDAGNSETHLLHPLAGRLHPVQCPTVRLYCPRSETEPNCIPCRRAPHGKLSTALASPAQRINVRRFRTAAICRCAVGRYRVREQSHCDERGGKDQDNNQCWTA